MSDLHKILAFWFEGLNDNTPLTHKIPIVKKWFNGDHAFDQTIKNKFEEMLKNTSARIDELDCTLPEDKLALVILFDQFPRNMYRQSPKAYNYDYLALYLADEALNLGEDKQMPFYQRTFFYMPFMHAEDLTLQRRSVECFEKIIEEAKMHCPLNVPYFVNQLNYARQHCAIIEKFSRFPHRNILLGRESTEKERLFLENKTI